MTQQAAEEARLEVLGQLYSELRAYRSKEFQTFIFAFPIIGAGLLPNLEADVWLKVLLTTFGVILVAYLWRNHYRMMDIKEEIVHFQKITGVHDNFEHLDPDEWIEKKPERHLGTVV